MSSEGNINKKKLALVLSGGGTRSLYQLGFLCSLADHFPQLDIPIITGVSAGAINATHIANYPGDFGNAIKDLTDTWYNVTPELVFDFDFSGFAFSLLKRGTGLDILSKMGKKHKALLKTTDLYEYLTERMHTDQGNFSNIEENIARGHIESIAVTTTNYSTGQSYTWSQGSELKDWDRPLRINVKTQLRLDHVMASIALPILFPAVQLRNCWHGDGGLRQYSPLSPAIHLGAEKIIAISTRYRQSMQEAEESVITDYPPPAHIAGIMMNSMFLDVLERDVHRLKQINELIDDEEESGRRKVDVYLQRPSEDLGKLAEEYKDELPLGFRALVRSLGSRETSSQDWLSLALFSKEYMSRVIEIGKADAEAKKDEMKEFLKL